MLAFLRHNAIALLALFVALGGTSAYAINTISSTDIVDGQVKNPDLATDAVTTGKIAAGAVAWDDLATAAVTGGKIKDLSIAGIDLNNGAVTGAKVANDTLTGANVNESSLGIVPNANTLDGNPAGTFLNMQRTTRQRTSDCITTANLWLACAQQTLTVPAGHYYYVTVISTFTANPGNFHATALLCPATAGPSCMNSNPNYQTFPANEYNNWSSASTSLFYAGTYTFNTAVKFPTIPPATVDADISTTVLAYDYRQEYAAG